MIVLEFYNKDSICCYELDVCLEYNKIKSIFYDKEECLYLGSMQDYPHYININQISNMINLFLNNSNNHSIHYIYISYSSNPAFPLLLFRMLLKFNGELCTEKTILYQKISYIMEEERLFLKKAEEGCQHFIPKNSLALDIINENQR